MHIQRKIHTQKPRQMACIMYTLYMIITNKWFFIYKIVFLLSRNFMSNPVCKYMQQSGQWESWDDGFVSHCERVTLESNLSIGIIQCVSVHVSLFVSILWGVQIQTSKPLWADPNLCKLTLELRGRTGQQLKSNHLSSPGWFTLSNVKKWQKKSKPYDSFEQLKTHDFLMRPSQCRKPTTMGEQKESVYPTWSCYGLKQFPLLDCDPPILAHKQWLMTSDANHCCHSLDMMPCDPEVLSDSVCFHGKWEPASGTL